MTLEEAQSILNADIEEGGTVKILKGPPVPSILPEKGLGFFFEGGKTRFYVLSKFNNSDTILRMPVSFKDAMRVLWNMRG